MTHTPLPARRPGNPVGGALRAGLAALLSAALLGAVPAVAQGQAAAATAQVHAGGTTGHLARLCATPETDPNHLAATYYCRGVLVGVGQSHAILTTGSRGSQPVFCLPDPSPSLAEVSAAFVRWAAANPQDAEANSAAGVLRFAAATYPCTARRR